MKFNQFKYSQLVFLKSIKKYLNNTKNLSSWNKKKSKKSYFRKWIEYIFFIFPMHFNQLIIKIYEFQKH